MSGKRMAVKAERLKKSKKYPKYWKYAIDIEDETGEVSQIPAYGIDLEDALTSVQLIERRVWLMRFFNKVPQWVAFLVGGVIMSGAALLSEYSSSPTWIVSLLGVIGLVGGILYFINGRIDKHMVNMNE